MKSIVQYKELLCLRSFKLRVGVNWSKKISLCTPSYPTRSSPTSSRSTRSANTKSCPSALWSPPTTTLTIIATSATFDPSPCRTTSTIALLSSMMHPPTIQAHRYWSTCRTRIRSRALIMSSYTILRTREAQRISERLHSNTANPKRFLW